MRQILFFFCILTAKINKSSISKISYGNNDIFIHSKLLDKVPKVVTDTLCDDLFTFIFIQK